MRVTDDGQVRLALRHRWTDGTTHVSFAPVELLGRLAVLVPRPRINLILYHGVLGPRAAWRSAVVRREPAQSGGSEARTQHPSGQAGHGEPRTDAPDAAWRRVRGQRWADLMRRTFGFDVLACLRCGGRLRLIALIEQAAVIQRILGHLGLSTEIPVPRPARAPPLPIDRDACPLCVLSPPVMPRQQAMQKSHFDSRSFRVAGCNQ